MEKCESCKFWQSPESEYGEIPGVGRCMAVVEFWDASQWDESTDIYKRVLKPEFEKTLAFVQDGSDYHAELKTLPNFGCVMHVPNEQLP